MEEEEDRDLAGKNISEPPVYRTALANLNPGQVRKVPVLIMIRTKR